MTMLACYDPYDSDLQDFERFVADRCRQGSRGGLSSSAHDARCLYLPKSDLVEFFRDEDRLLRILRYVMPNLENPLQCSDVLERIKEGDYYNVLAILLLIRRGNAIRSFIEDPDLSDEKLPFDNPKKFPGLAADPEFFHEFYSRQWMFCVRKLRYRRFVKLSADEILPYKIEQTLVPGASSKAFVITVDPDYNNLFSSNAGRLYTENHVRPHVHPNTFVLKSFENEIPDGKEQYDQELNSFATLLHTGNGPNIVGFFGSFKHGDTFHILLEYANTGTLEELMQTAPPTSPEDLYELWGALLQLLRALMTLHNLKFPSEDGSPSEGFICHNDFKPRNILVFIGRDNTRSLFEFKLADLGLSRLMMKVGASKQSLAAAGTRTYGAPELHHTSNAVSLPLLQAGPEVDIWSCGCVFSEVATWIRCGPGGLASFRRMRSQAHSDPALRGSDCFHDGLRLLQCIAEHHASLRKHTPPHDLLTEPVLDMIESHMLVDKPHRHDAQTLFWKASQMHHQCRTMRSPTAVNQFDQLQQPADPQQHVLHDNHVPSGSSKGNSPPPTPFDGSMNLLRMGLSPSVTSPTAQGAMSTSTSEEFGRSVIEGASGLPTSAHIENVHEANLNDKHIQEQISLVSAKPPVSSPPTKNVHPKPSANESRGSSSGLHNKEFPQSNLDQKTIQSNGPTTPTGRSKFAYCPVEIVWQRRIHRTKLPAYHTRDLVDHDPVFLIDDSSSMRDHWRDVVKCVDMLGYEVKRFGRGGIEVCFTFSSVKKKHRNTTPLVKLVERLLSPDPPTEQLPDTNISSSLGSLLDGYRRLIETGRTVRKQIIYVLTDGNWQPYSPQSLVHSIQNLVSSLDKMKSPMNQIGIQFIQFGDNPEATKLLQDLDDLDVARDIIDRELFTAEGNVWKMLVGSINKYADNNGISASTKELRSNSAISPSSPPPVPHRMSPTISSEDTTRRSKHLRHSKWLSASQNGSRPLPNSGCQSTTA